MRTFLVIALVLTAGLASLWVWGAAHANRMAAPSSSQIVIHGTPVCVTQRGGQIEAAVGECDRFSGDPQDGAGGYHAGRSVPGNPHLELPPGHPPIDSEPSHGFEERRGTRTLI